MRRDMAPTQITLYSDDDVTDDEFVCITTYYYLFIIDS